MRTGLSSLTPRFPLCRIYSLSVTFFTCGLGEQLLQQITAVEQQELKPFV